jgi:hypothetical protein
MLEAYYPDWANMAASENEHVRDLGIATNRLCRYGAEGGIFDGPREWFVERLTRFCEEVVLSHRANWMPAEMAMVLQHCMPPLLQNLNGVFSHSQMYWIYSQFNECNQEERSQERYWQGYTFENIASAVASHITHNRIEWLTRLGEVTSLGFSNIPAAFATALSELIDPSNPRSEATNVRDYTREFIANYRQLRQFASSAGSVHETPASRRMANLLANPFPGLITNDTEAYFASGNDTEAYFASGADAMVELSMRYQLASPNTVGSLPRLPVTRPSLNTPTPTPTEASRPHRRIVIRDEEE